MSAVSRQLPEGRYGRSTGRRDDRADRRLKIVGAVLGTALIALVAWFGYHYVGGQKVSAQVVAFKAVSDHAVRVHLEVHKDAGTDGSCTLRSVSEDGTEVGRADFRFTQHRGQIDQVVTLRTTTRGASAELVGCHTA